MIIYIFATRPPSNRLLSPSFIPWFLLVPCSYNNNNNNNNDDNNNNDNNDTIGTIFKWKSLIVVCLYQIGSTIQSCCPLAGERGRINCLRSCYAVIFLNDSHFHGNFHRHASVKIRSSRNGMEGSKKWSNVKCFGIGRGKWQLVRSREDSMYCLLCYIFETGWCLHCCCLDHLVNKMGNNCCP